MDTIDRYQWDAAWFTDGVACLTRILKSLNKQLAILSRMLGLVRLKDAKETKMRKERPYS